MSKLYSFFLDHRSARFYTFPHHWGTVGNCENDENQFTVDKKVEERIQRNFNVDGYQIIDIKEIINVPLYRKFQM